MVKDMDEALKFYCGLLGMKVIVDYIEQGDHIDKMFGWKNVMFREVKLSPSGQLEDGACIQLIEFFSSLEADFRHTALQVDDLEETYWELSGAGVKFLTPPFTSPDGYAKVACCCAPNGYYLELVEVL